MKNQADLYESIAQALTADNALPKGAGFTSEQRWDLLDRLYALRARAEIVSVTVEGPQPYFAEYLQIERPGLALLVWPDGSSVVIG